MTTVLLSNPFSYPLHPLGWPRPAVSKDYRITNPFDGPDFLNGGIHRAVDVGNKSLDDVVYAPVKCRAMGRRHHDSALGVIFDPGHGVLIELWHLNATLAPIGTWQEVQRGQVVGRTGNTGAQLPDGSPMPAHTHIAASRNGVPFDIEPYLPMVERPARALVLEEDVSVLETKTTYLREPFVAVLKPSTAIRQDTNTDGTPVNRTPRTGDPVEVVVIGTAQGETVEGSSVWWVYGSHQRSLLTLHSSTVAARRVIGASCDTERAEITRLQTQIARAATSATGAAQAATATLEALR